MITATENVTFEHIHILNEPGVFVFIDFLQFCAIIHDDSDCDSE